MTNSQAERAAAVAVYWAQESRRDDEMIRGSIKGMGAAEVAEVRAILATGALDGLSDQELLDRMMGLASKVVAGEVEHKAMSMIEAPPEAGSFEGYASTWLDRGGPDQGGDVIVPGAFTVWVEEVNSGARSVPIVAGEELGGHSNAPMAVVGRVVQARQDQTGLWIAASMSTDPTAQLLRQKITSGALTGLSISYTPGSVRMVTLPDGQEARELGGPIVVHHVALTPIPMNTSARIYGAKARGALVPSAPIVDLYQDVQDRRRDPDRDRRRRMAEVMAQTGWPPPHLIATLGVEGAYAWWRAPPEPRPSARSSVTLSGNGGSRPTATQTTSPRGWRRTGSSATARPRGPGRPARSSPRWRPPASRSSRRPPGTPPRRAGSSTTPSTRAPCATSTSQC
jgi:HK97 family phage prohead protease